MTDSDPNTTPDCKFDEGCHRVVPCAPGCGTPWPAVPDRAALREHIAEAIHADLVSAAYRRDGGLLGIVPRLADAVLAVLPPSADRAATCICGHAEQQHFEDVCQVCDCGDFLPPAAAREVIARYQETVKREPADRAAVLREAADRIDATREPFPIAVQNGIIWATAELRRLADEAQQQETVVTVHAAPDLSPAASEALDALVEVAKRQMDCDFEHPHPAHPCGRQVDETQQQPDTETPFVPPVHYVRDDAVPCCVHTIPVGPDSCRECRDLDQPAVPARPAVPDVLTDAVAALQAKAAELSTKADEEMRRDLEEQAQVWHEAADMVRRVGRKAARR